MTPEQYYQENQALVEYIYSRHFAFHRQNRQWKDDLLQEGRLALWRACMSYKEDSGNLFSTLAYPCIYNSMCLYLRRKLSKHFSNVSLEEPVSETKNKDSIVTIEETLSVEDFTLVYDSVSLINKVLSEYPKTWQKMFILSVQGYTQKEIEKKLKISQAQISRCLTKIRNKIKKQMEEP